jgi:hypothetical protein
MGDEASEEIAASISSSEATRLEVVAAVGALREDVKRLSDALAHLAQSQGGIAGAAFAEVVADAKGQVSQAASEVESFVLDVEAGLRSWIRERPLSAALILTFFGFALGRLDGLRRAH